MRGYLRLGGMGGGGGGGGGGVLKLKKFWQ